MSVLIKGMEMPPSCVLCRMSEYHVSNPYCKITEAKILRNRDRNNDCPLVPVPPHGRLIDADALIDDVRRNSESYFADDFAHEWVDKAPTIIPASEEGE